MKRILTLLLTVVILLPCFVTGCDFFNKTESITTEATTPQTTPSEITPEETTSEISSYPEETTTPEETTSEVCVHEWSDATCTTPKTCSKCGETEGSVSDAHIAGEAATCTTAQTCTVCGTELNAALGHTAGETVVENEVAADCENDGSYDNVVYCSVCDAEISRKTVIVDTLGHHNELVVTPPTCTEGGYTTYTCAVCGDSYVYDEVAPLGHTWTDATCALPKTCSVCGTTEGSATGKHSISDLGVCTVCNESFVLSIEEVIEIGMSYEKGKYSSEYYYVELTLDNQVNPNGFARMTVREGLYITVNGGYLTGDAQGTVLLGDTVVFKAKIGSANSALTTGGKEARLYEVASFKITAFGDTTPDDTTPDDTAPETIPPEWNVPTDKEANVSPMISYQSTYASFARVDTTPEGVPFGKGYYYVKKSGTASIDKSALVWNNATYHNGYVSFVVYVHTVTDRAGAAYHEVELQLAGGAKFVSAVDANGNALEIFNKNEKPNIVLKKGQVYRVVVDMSDTFNPEFYFGWGGRTCELYFNGFSIEKPQYEYFIDNVTQTVVCKKDGEAYGYFAWPTVTKLDGNRLIAVASGFRQAHIDTESKVAVWFSEDGGNTWSEPRVLVDTLLDDRDSGVVYWNGKIIVSWFCASKAYYLNYDSKKYSDWAATIDDAYDTKYMGGNYIISEDGGNTWSEIYNMPEGMFTPHGLIINPDGGLTSVGYLKYDKENKRWGTGIAVRTTDGTMDENGFVWSDAIVIADSNTQYSMDFQEPYGIYNDDGVLIVVMRSDKGLYQCELQPGATKFSSWHKIAFVQETPAHMIQHSSGVMIMTYGYRGIYIDPVTGATVSYTERNKDTTLGIRARISYDGGLTWTREVVLTHGLYPASNSSDWGYTSSVELSDGKILTLFYQRTGNETMASIYQIVWELPQAPKGEITLTLVNGKDGNPANVGTLITTVKDQAGEKIVISTPKMEGYKFDGWYLDYIYSVPFTPTTYSKDLILYAKWVVDTQKVVSVMSFNIKVGDLDGGRSDRVVNTILDNAPAVFGVQEATGYDWMPTLKDKLGSLYSSVGTGRDSFGLGEHSAIFYRTDLFTLVDSGTKWLSATPDKESLYSYTENGTTYKANYKRIMTYVVLERKSDGARFIYVNTHLDNNGDNGSAVAEKVRQGQVAILIAEIQKLQKTYGNLPTIVSGDFNCLPSASAYKAMTETYKYSDSSKVALKGEVKPTSNGMTDATSDDGIIDYIFVSSDLANAVQTYTVCPSKRDGQWISDHNAIIATVIISKK